MSDPQLCSCQGAGSRLYEGAASMDHLDPDRLAVSQDSRSVQEDSVSQPGVISQAFS